MVGFLKKLRGMFGAFTNTQELKQRIELLEKEKIELDKRADDLAKATLNGDEHWFVSAVRKDPVCAMKALKECER